MWNPEQYNRFVSERSQPFHDLVGLLEPKPHARVVDLGCGTGALTRQLHDHLDAAETLGIDSATSMLAAASAHADERLRFEQCAIEAFQPQGKYDVILSNAALQWLPDHDRLFARLSELLAADGQLAIQIPTNNDHPSQTAAIEVAEERNIAPCILEVLPPERYAALLYDLGFKKINVRVQIYPHVLATSDDLVEWMKGTLLTDYQRRLDAEAFSAFLSHYASRVREKVGEQSPYFFTFKRVLIWGRR